MATEPSERIEAGPSTGPHRMRITSGGQVYSYVNFALTFLKDHPDRPLVLHTLRPAEQTSPDAEAAEAGPSTSKKSPPSTSSLTPELLVTPKLVSVAEKIKREYMVYANSPQVGNGKANDKGKGKGKGKAVGIWQYTESGVLPGPRQEELGLDSILEGRNKPKLIHRPYLQITLSTKPLGLEAGAKGRNVTCQYVMVRRRKARSAKRPSQDPERPVAVKVGGGEVEEEQSGLVVADSTVGRTTEKKGDVATKRKADNSQTSDATRGGKKRKK